MRRCLKHFAGWSRFACPATQSINPSAPKASAGLESWFGCCIGYGSQLNHQSTGVGPCCHFPFHFVYLFLTSHLGRRIKKKEKPSTFPPCAWKRSMSQSDGSCCEPPCALQNIGTIGHGRCLSQPLPAASRNCSRSTPAPQACTSKPNRSCRGIECGHTDSRSCKHRWPFGKIDGLVVNEINPI